MDILTLAVQALVPVVGLILVAFGRWARGTAVASGGKVRPSWK